LLTIGLCPFTEELIFFHVNSKVQYLSLKIKWMNEWMAGHLPFLNRASWYARVRRTNKMYTFLINDLINYFFDMFRTTKSSPSGSLYKQLYGILSRICISSLVFDMMCWIHTSCQWQDFLYRCMLMKNVCILLVLLAY